MKKKLILCAVALAATLAAIGERKAEAAYCPPGYTFCCTATYTGCFPTFKCFKPCVPG